MKMRWKKGLAEIAIWLVAEIILKFLGLNNLADYSEFIFNQKEIVIGGLLEPAMVTRVI